MDGCAAAGFVFPEDELEMLIGQERSATVLLKNRNLTDRGTAYGLSRLDQSGRMCAD